MTSSVLLVLSQIPGGIPLPPNDPSLCNQLSKALLIHTSLLSGDHTLEKDTAAASCRSVLPAAILGLTWRACSLALEALRAGHKKKDKEVRQPRIPQSR